MTHQKRRSAVVVRIRFQAKDSITIIVRAIDGIEPLELSGAVLAIVVNAHTFSRSISHVVVGLGERLPIFQLLGNFFKRRTIGIIEPSFFAVTLVVAIYGLDSKPAKSSRVTNVLDQLVGSTHDDGSIVFEAVVCRKGNRRYVICLLEIHPVF